MRDNQNLTYRQVIDFLYNSLPAYHLVGKAAYKANLDNTYALDEYFSHPHRSFKSIHVAGTNGKGSVSHTLASILQEAGYKVGLYTSPHLKDFRERIKVDGEMIPEEAVVNFVETNKPIINRLKPSFFELTVAMAFQWFAISKVDIAVVEVGLGGRLDSTNIITPLLSVITNIGLEHTELLGDTLAKIAAEKAGIIKSGIPVVIGESDSETKPVFLAKAREMSSDILFADDTFKASWVDGLQDVSSTGDSSEDLSITKRDNYLSKPKSYGQMVKEYVVNSEDQSFMGVTPLFGEYQLKNIQTVMQAVRLLNDELAITKDDVMRGVANVITNTGLLGRWQIIGENPLTICDTGHNKHGMDYTVRQLESLPKSDLRCVLGFSGDKDVESILAMFPKNAHYYFTRAGSERAMSLSKLCGIAEMCGLRGEQYDSVIAAYEAAKRDADGNDVIFIGGSIFVVAEVI